MTRAAANKLPRKTFGRLCLFGGDNFRFDEPERFRLIDLLHKSIFQARTFNVCKTFVIAESDLCKRSVVRTIFRFVQKSA